jgi:hypothetical protein
MRHRHKAALAPLTLPANGTAWAEVVNLTNGAEGANRAQGLEAVFGETSTNPDLPKPYHVDGKMKRDLP